MFGFHSEVEEAKDLCEKLRLELSAVEEPLNQLLEGYRHPAPPVNESSIWTFLAVLTLRLGVPRDLRVVLYGAYVRLQYGSCCSSFPPVMCILSGGTWFAGGPNTAQCIDKFCSEPVSGWRGRVSKLQYEQDLQTHFESTHGVAWEDFASKHATCTHSDPRNQQRLSDSLFGLLHPLYCVDCGKIIQCSL